MNWNTIRNYHVAAVKAWCVSFLCATELLLSANIHTPLSHVVAQCHVLHQDQHERFGLSGVDSKHTKPAVVSTHCLTELIPNYK